VDGGILESVLEGVPLPARRDEIVEYAEIEGAGANLLTGLRALEDREYESFDELADALDAARA
jgi:Protein of unknown function (DUF2795)